ncbi:MAG: phage portal protein [Erysipelotrichaceae bacterium]
MIGANFTRDQIEQLKDNRVISGIPSDADIKYLIKNLNEADTDVLRKTIESDIHKISMTPNMSDANFVGNSSGVAIRYKLLAFEQNIKNKERYMEKGLMERFKLYNAFLSTKSLMSVVPIEEVDSVFKRNLPSNDLEISQMISNLSGVVDNETLISQLSFIKNAKEITELVQKEQKEPIDLPNMLEIEKEDTSPIEQVEEDVEV